MRKVFYVVAMVSMVGASGAATAQALSTGCTLLNNDALDSLNPGASPNGLEFFANEVISITASTPTGARNATDITLSLDGTQVDSDSFPGSLSYRFLAAAASVDVEYQAFDATILDGPNSAEVTWDVSCATFVAPPASVPATPWQILLLLASGLAYLGYRNPRNKRKRRLLR